MTKRERGLLILFLTVGLLTTFACFYFLAQSPFTAPIAGGLYRATKDAVIATFLLAKLFGTIFFGLIFESWITALIFFGVITLIILKVIIERERR